MAVFNHKLRRPESIVYLNNNDEKPICSIMNKYKFTGNFQNLMPRYSIDWSKNFRRNERKEAPNLRLTNHSRNFSNTDLKLLTKIYEKNDKVLIKLRKSTSHQKH